MWTGENHPIIYKKITTAGAINFIDENCIKNVEDTMVEIATWKTNGFWFPYRTARAFLYISKDLKWIADWWNSKRRPWMFSPSIFGDDVWGSDAFMLWKLSEMNFDETCISSGGSLTDLKKITLYDVAVVLREIYEIKRILHNYDFSGRVDDRADGSTAETMQLFYICKEGDPIKSYSDDHVIEEICKSVQNKYKFLFKINKVKSRVEKVYPDHDQNPTTMGRGDVFSVTLEFKNEAKDVSRKKEAAFLRDDLKIENVHYTTRGFTADIKKKEKEIKQIYDDIGEDNMFAAVDTEWDDRIKKVHEYKKSKRQVDHINDLIGDEKEFINDDKYHKCTPETKERIDKIVNELDKIQREEEEEEEAETAEEEEEEEAETAEEEAREREEQRKEQLFRSLLAALSDSEEHSSNSEAEFKNSEANENTQSHGWVEAIVMYFFMSIYSILTCPFVCRRFGRYMCEDADEQLGLKYKLWCGEVNYMRAAALNGEGSTEVVRKNLTLHIKNAKEAYEKGGYFNIRE